MRARPWMKAHSPSKCQQRHMMLILSEQVTASSHHILPRPVFPASREAKKTQIESHIKGRNSMSQVISFMFTSVALVSFTMFRVPFGLSQLSMVHLAKKKELVYMNWSQKKRIRIKSLQESASTMPVLSLSLFPCETRNPIKQVF